MPLLGKQVEEGGLEGTASTRTMAWRAKAVQGLVGIKTAKGRKVLGKPLGAVAQGLAAQLRQRSGVAVPLPTAVGGQLEEQACAFPQPTMGATPRVPQTQRVGAVAGRDDSHGIR